MRATHRSLGIPVATVVLAGLLITGCVEPPDGNGTPPGEIVQSAKPRVNSPAVPQPDLAELVAGNGTFALELYQQVREEPGNVFYSPYSISLALAMTYAGARGETEQQVGDTLRFTLPQERLHPAFNTLDLELASRGEGAAGADGEGFRLNIVNRLWGQVGYVFLAEFLDVLAENYGAGLCLLDFANEPEPSRIEINDWVSDQTEGRIEDLIPPNVISSLTRLVLTNAIYFNAAWNTPFDEDLTEDGPFYLLDGGTVSIPMMRQEETLGYAAGDGYQVLELPYDGEELSMVILLPDAGRFEEFESALDSAQVSGFVALLARQRVDLSMPRFTFEWSTSLKDVLSAMGMPLAFGGAADFSGMDGTLQLFIGDVLHKAFVAVNEEGTEAAAATAVIMKLTAVPPPALVVTVDRPFVFLIRDIETGAILFVGRVVDPSAS